MGECISQQGAENDPLASLRQEYLNLLSRDFLDLPFTLAFGATDPRQRDTLLPTLEEYERLVSLYRDGALPPKDAGRAAELCQSVIDHIRQGTGPRGTPMSEEQITRWEEQHLQKVASGTYHGIVEMIEGLSRQVELDLASLHLSLPVPVYVGEYPTGNFNAWTIPSSSGVLVLINRGLFVFIYLMAKLYALCVHIDFPEPGDTSIRINADGLVIPEDSPPKSAIVDLALDVLLSYLTFRQPTKARRLPPLPWPRGQVVTIVTGQTEKFVIAHEYGHVVAGHVTAAKVGQEPEAGHGIHHVAMDHAKEFEADAYGAAVMITRDATAAGIGGGELGWRQAVAAGPAFFFALDELVLRFVAVPGQAPPVACDHPPSALRWQLLRPGFQLTSRPAALALADGCMLWARALGDDAVRRLAELRARH